MRQVPTRAWHCSIAIIALAVVIPCPGHTTEASSPKEPCDRIPARLKHVGVVTGQGMLAKKLWYEQTGLGKITDIRWGNFDGEPGEEFVVVGTQGAAFLRPDGGQKSTVRFDWRAIGEYWGEHVVAADMDNDGQCEFLDRAGAWLPPVALLSHRGKPLWTYTSDDGVDNAVAGDVNGDGRLEVAVGFNGGGGVHLVDRDGRTLWKQPDGNVWHLEMLDVNGDGKPEIVHSNAAGQITVRDAQGQVLWRTEDKTSVSDFCTVAWPNVTPAALLFVDEGHLRVLDVRGATKASKSLLLTAAGPSVWFTWQSAAWVTQKGQPARLAVLLDQEVYDRGLLLLFDDALNLLYQEVLGTSGAALYAGGPLAGQGRVLVGAEDQVWEYRLTPRE
jgi:hypothetical protein